MSRPIELIGDIINDIKDAESSKVLLVKTRDSRSFWALYEQTDGGHYVRIVGTDQFIFSDTRRDITAIVDHENIVILKSSFRGPRGKKGSTGRRGCRGTPGLSGSPGPQGVSGSPSQSVSGAQGISGAPGSTGISGAPGEGISGAPGGGYFWSSWW